MVAIRRLILGQAVLPFVLLATFVEKGEDHRLLPLLIASAIWVGLILGRCMMSPLSEMKQPMRRHAPNSPTETADVRYARLYQEGMKSVVRCTNWAIGLGLLGLVVYGGWLFLS